MIVRLLPPPIISYDPFEEDCVGSHPGDTAEIRVGDRNNILLEVEETKSGIGPSYEVFLTGPLFPRQKVAYFSTEDGPELVVDTPRIIPRRD